MFKTNGEKALLAVCVVTIVFMGMALVTGVGNEVKADESPVEPAVFWYFERMPDDHYRISGDELQSLLKANKEIFILDIRNAEDYEKDHIEGAVNIPFVQVGDNLDKIPKNKLVVLYCYSGQNGGQVVALLNILGYHAKSLSGGWGGWLAALGKPNVPATNPATGSPAEQANPETASPTGVTCPG